MMPATLLLTIVAMLAFAANSLLARLALIDGAIDAAGFTGLRLASGALALALMLAWRNRKALQPADGADDANLPGSWVSAGALFVYAAAFSVAYLDLGAGMGALILFVSVQMTMIGWGLWSGERPGPMRIAGLVLAVAGFVYLVGPNAERPDMQGALTMIVSGIAWGVYSLRGRSGGDPAGATAGNFIRTTPIAVVLAIGSVAAAGMSGWGIALSLASGIVASAGGYILWYRVLPSLAATQAAVVQLAVPVIAAIGGVAFIGEPLTVQLVVAGAVILAGIWLAIAGKSTTAGRK